MTTNGAAPEPPAVVRRLDNESASAIVHLVEMFDDLQMVLRCCDRLVTVLAAEGEPDAVVVEAVWTVALLSYSRSFSPDEGGVTLTEDDVTATQGSEEALEWHRLLLRDHHADPAVNPRERFSVGVTQDASGQASGVAITSARQPLVDDLTVRQTGAIAYALSALVNQRIESRQEEMFDEAKALPQGELDKLVALDVAEPAGP